MLSRVGFPETGVRGLDQEATAVPHGVAGVCDEVEDHLRELAAVDLDFPKFAAEREFELDIFLDDAAQERLEIGQDDT
jgi:hypothetical protein